MSVIGSEILAGASGNQGYFIQRSLRFRSSASAYLNRTPASAGNQQKWTWSGWAKLGLIDSNGHALFGVQGASGTDYFGIVTGLNAANDLAITELVSATNQIRVSTTAVYRDPSAWYHIVVAYDSTAALQDNRLVLYVNNVTQALSGTKVTLNYSAYVNSTRAHQICRTLQGGGTAGNYFDGYLAEVNFIDGQALTPSSFGQTDAVTGVWIPKKYAGTYGTNGFYLPFSNNTSATTLAYDFSGNGNNWTPNNISTTAGATYDSMTDVPTLTSATAANYCTLNPIGYGYQFSSSYASSPSLATGATLTQGNLYARGANAGTGYYGSWVGTMPLDNGKWYWEATLTAEPTADFSFPGIVRYDNGTTNAPYLASNGSYTLNDVLGFTWDDTAKELKWYKNGTLQTTIVTGATGSYLPFVGLANANEMAFNFGQRPFSYTPPTGFVALNTFNLPDPTIKKPNQYMDATTFTGTGGAVTVTNAGGFQPDLVWAKGRSTAQNNWLNDSVRGAGNTLFSNLTNAEQSGVVLTSFNSNGFTGDASFTNAATYVGWQWQAGKGTTSSNTSGSITSTVSVNTTAGFSIVTFASDGTTAGGTAGHGLGVAPKMVIYKGRNTVENWHVYHASLGATNAVYLNLTNASTATGAFNSTAPTSSVIQLRQLSWGAGNVVAYCFAEIPGFSKFGSYTGNGSADGPFVYCGFRPKYVMWKRTDSANDWFVEDTSRSTYNVIDKSLSPDTSAAEYSSLQIYVDALSNGFKIRSSYDLINASGGNYIYAAFAENPFKYANAR